MSLVPDGWVSVDGDLSEWKDVPLSYMSDRWQRIWAEGEQAIRPDRALMQVARDGANLYLAFRVVDEEVINTQQDNIWRGDCVEVFLDVRPQEPAEDAPGLGQSPYSPGCCQLIFSPVTVAGQVGVRWRCVQEEPGAPKSLQVASRLLDDGYTVEVGIPFSELYGSTAERFDSPIGIGAQIEDAVAIKTGIGAGCVAYNWQGKRGNYRTPGNFGRTLLKPLGPPAPKVVAYLPARLSAWEKQRSFLTGVVVRAHHQAETPGVDLTWRREGSRADRPLKEEDWEIPPGAAVPTLKADYASRSWEDPVLGLRLAEKRLTLSQLLGGRYHVTSRCTLAGQTLSDTVRMYYMERKPRGWMVPIEKELGGQALTDAVASSLYLDMGCHHVFEDAEVEVTALPFSSLCWSLSKAAEDPSLGCRVRLDMSLLAGGAARWSATELLTVHGSRFTIPTAGLPNGLYAIRAVVVDPEGREKKVWRPAEEQYPGWAPTQILGIHRGRNYVLPGTVKDAAHMLTKCVAAGDPYRERYPRDDRDRCFARSIWDLQAHDGRIYTGCGDWGGDQGPIDVWSFGPPVGPDGKLVFNKEFTVDEESIELICELAGRLVIPGADTIGARDFGNIYIKEEGKWRKMRTVPNGLQVLGAAYLDDKLYVGTVTGAGAALYESSDWGETWTCRASDGQDEFLEGRYWELAPIRGRLLVTTSRAAEYLYVFENNRLKRVVAPFFPGGERGGPPHRLTEFKDGVLYTSRRWYEEPGGAAKPLYLVREPESGALLVEAFRDKNVQDIIVRGDRCYVLTSAPLGDAYEGGLYTSTDLRTWTRIARFTSPALARSLEELEGVFYVGLACISEEPNPMSGRICRLE